MALQAEAVLLTLKIAVIAVTVLLLASLTALARGNGRLHGRINMVFFALVMVALLGFEATIHVLSPGLVQDYLSRHGALQNLYIHLGFSVPAALVLPGMLFTGLSRRIGAHKPMGVVFLLLWLGTFITGVFFLPHTASP
jgi:uncharacterized membrane protein YozB (DUF420 family)